MSSRKKWMKGSRGLKMVQLGLSNVRSHSLRESEGNKFDEELVLPAPSNSDSDSSESGGTSTECGYVEVDPEELMLKDPVECLNQEAISTAALSPTKGKRNDKKKCKRHWCQICGDFRAKFKQHLMRKHRSDANVQRILDEPPKAQRESLRKYIRDGDFLHNLMFCKDPIVVRDNNDGGSLSRTHAPCSNCGGYFSRKRLWRHIKNCTPEKTTQTAVEGKIIINTAKEIGGKLGEIVARISHDVFDLISEDRVIRALGENLIVKYGHCNEKDPSYASRKNADEDFIRQRLRRYGLLLKAIKETTGTTGDFYEQISLKNYEYIKKAVCRMSSNFKHPHTALRAGEDLSEAISQCHDMAIISKDSQKREELADLSTLMHSNWKKTITVRARREAERMKSNRDNEPLPLLTDLATMRTILYEKIQRCMTAINEKPNKTNYVQLTKSLLCLAIFFNIRRAGEEGNIGIYHYYEAIKVRAAAISGEDPLVLIRPEDRETYKTLLFIRSPGKKSKEVKTVLDPFMITAAQTMVNNRVACGVLEQNPYLFANVGVLTNIRGSDAQRDEVDEASKFLKKPELLRSTKLRKLLATLVQQMDLGPNQRNIITDFMGHGIEIHDLFYRKKTDANTFQAAKVLVEITKSASLHDKRFSDLPLPIMDGVRQETSSRTLRQKQSLSKAPPSPATSDEPFEDSGSEYQPDDTDGEDIPGNRAAAFDVVVTPVKRSALPRKPWTPESKKFIMKVMNRHLASGTLPGKVESEGALQAAPVHSSIKKLKRKWQDVKDFVRNANVQKRRKLNQ